LANTATADDFKKEECISKRRHECFQSFKAGSTGNGCITPVHNTGEQKEGSNPSYFFRFRAR
jgi:hypothetical protein